MESTRLWPIKPLSVFHLPNSLYFNILFLISFSSGRLIPRPTPLGMHDIYIGNQTEYLWLQISQSHSRTKTWHSKAHFILLLLSLIFDTRPCLKHLATQEVACSSIWTFQNRRLLALIQVPPTWHPLEEAHSHCLYLQSYFFVTSQNLWPQVRVGM